MSSRVSDIQPIPSMAWENVFYSDWESSEGFEDSIGLRDIWDRALF